MKAQLTFDLDDYDDKIEHLRCVQASDICSAVWEFLNNTKEELTHNALIQNLDVEDSINLAYRRFWEILDERNIDIDKLIQ
jgi:hypothetical protein